jgi:hypothetical protein
MYPEVFFWRHRMIPIIPTYAGVPGFPPPALTRQRSTAESRVNQNFLVASAHTQHQKTGIEVTPMSFILELRRRVAPSSDARFC